MSTGKVYVVRSDVMRLMSDLKDWEGLILQLEYIVTWEKPFVLLYALFVVTTFYGILWILEPPILVSIGFACLTFSMWSFIGPKFSIRYFFSYIITFRRLLPPIPPSERYPRYREFCRRILDTREAIVSTFKHISYLRQRRPYIYTIVCLTLVITAEIVTYHFDGVLLAYILTILALVVPGFLHTGIFHVSFLWPFSGILN